ncbi:hypothetical protein [Saprospira grandis]|uniref:hypothetical protein n=1 Tax=Saprospira grandis TaxID=1008 RepID=UPI0022DE3745|nr:hypothetical protein [Saprospira grandis]WBM75107.1 hypothetical protein OP864_02470 [Saprospira grandis]
MEATYEYEAKPAWTPYSTVTTEISTAVYLRTQELGVATLRREGIAFYSDIDSAAPVQYQNERGYHRYALSNFRGDLRMEISDIKLPMGRDLTVATYYLADVLSATDAYAYGWEMPGRNFPGAIPPEYGHNGMRKSPEIGSGHHTTYFRELDGRIGRWWSADPITFPHQSPYNTFDGNPIYYTDASGASVSYPKKEKEESYKATVSTEISSTSFARSYVAEVANGGGDPPKKRINIYITNTHRTKKENGKTVPDKALVSSYNSAKDVENNNGWTIWANETNFYVVEAKGVKDAAAKIKNLKSKYDAEVGILYIDSHGYRSTNSFRIGDQIVDAGNIGSRTNTVLAPIAKELAKDISTVVILACNAGANDPGTSGALGRGDVFVQKLANRFQADVYANRSWSPSGDIFGSYWLGGKLQYSPNSLDASHYGNGVSEKITTYKSCPHCFEGLGLWGWASPTPSGPAINTKTVNVIKLKPGGDFEVSGKNYYKIHKGDIDLIRLKSKNKK